MLDSRVELPSVEWCRHSGLVSSPPSPLSLKQYHMDLWLFVKGQSFVILKGRQDLRVGGNIQATSVLENKAD